jgi:hypothetical protein
MWNFSDLNIMINDKYYKYYKKNIYESYYYIYENVQ